MSWLPHSKRLLWLCSIALIICLILRFAPVVNPDNEYSQGDGNYLWYEKDTIVERIVLPEAIEFMSARNSTRRSIFFIETSKNGTLNARQCCTIESAARHNPNMDIFLILLDPPKNPSLMQQDMVQSVLRHHKNVQVLMTTTDKYLEGTPVYNLRELMWASKYPKEHTSDVTRILTVFRFGGMYFDLDFIIQRSLEELPLNWVSIQDENGGTNAAFGFEKGSRVAREMLEVVSKIFSTDDYIRSGPYLFTQMLKRECGDEFVKASKNGKCTDFEIMPYEELYAVPWYEYQKFFDQSVADVTMETVKESFAVHFWNHVSHDSVVQVGSDNAYSRLAVQHCPRSYWSCYNTF